MISTIIKFMLNSLTVKLASVSNYYGISNYNNYVTAITTITKLIFSYMKITALRHFELQQLRYNLLQPLQHITATNTTLSHFNRNIHTCVVFNNFSPTLKLQY